MEEIDVEIIDNDNAYDKIVSRNITTEMKTSFLDYAMSVIVSRALPDVRDGLKPVHRRIIYAMNDIGLHADKQYRKSATVVGEVLGKYHPHGDSSVYDAMVRMAQDFSIRYPLVDGHGNFGSMDGDEPAAMRYTEAKMTKIAMMLVDNLKEDTIDFTDNFDAREKEPTVLPARYPNLLANGASGIAVGMATNIPPHNLGELIDGIIAYINDPDISISDLMTNYIQGPDFPTGALILGRSGIKNAYETGKGSIVMRAVSHIETLKNGKNRIVFTEVPYQLNKENVVTRIAELVNNNQIEGITEIRDETNREGIRLVIELKKDINTDVVLNRLYKLTALQSNFSVNSLALVKGKPELLNLKEMIKHYVIHQQEVIVRRTRFRYKQAFDRAHILEGLKLALDNIDLVIDIIRSSKSDPEAISSLISEFDFSDIQAKAIMDMRLGRLTGLAREKLDAELNTLHETMNYLQDILDNPIRVDETIIEELSVIKDKFADKRRSQIITGDFDLEDEDLIPEETVIVTITKNGYIKRLPEDTYRTQKRGGRGVKGITTNEEDDLEQMLTLSSHAYILAFSNKGRVYRLKAYQVPEFSRISKGIPIVNLLPSLENDENIVVLKSVKEFSDNHYLVLATKNGLVKRTPLKEYTNINRNGKIAIGLKENDELFKTIITDGQSEIFLASNAGYLVRFNESDIRPSGRTSMGVKGINLKDGAFVVGFDSSLDGDKILTISEKGYGKLTSIDGENSKGYRKTKRGGKGVKTINITEKNGRLVSMRCIKQSDSLIVATTDGIIIKTDLDQISEKGRNSIGVRIIKVDDNQSVSSVSIVEKDQYSDDEIIDEIDTNQNDAENIIESIN